MSKSLLKIFSELKTRFLTSTLPCFHKLISNFRSYKDYCKIPSFLILMTSGLTPGVTQISHPLRCILGTSKKRLLLLSLNTCGRMPPCSDTRSSSGCSYMTELTQEICFRESPSSYPPIVVLFVTQGQKKLLFTFFGIALLLEIAGTASPLIGTEVLLSWMRSI